MFFWSSSYYQKVVGEKYFYHKDEKNNIEFKNNIQDDIDDFDVEAYHQELSQMVENNEQIPPRLGAKWDNLLIPAYCAVLNHNYQKKDKTAQDVEMFEVKYAMSPYIFKTMIEAFIEKTIDDNTRPHCLRILCGSGDMNYPHVCAFELRKVIFKENNEQKITYSLIGIDSTSVERADHPLDDPEMRKKAYEDRATSFFSGTPSSDAVLSQLFQCDDKEGYTLYRVDCKKNDVLIKIPLKYAHFNTGLQTSPCECAVFACGFIKKMYSALEKMKNCHLQNVKNQIQYRYQYHVGFVEACRLLPIKCFKFSQSKKTIDAYFKNKPENNMVSINKKKQNLKEYVEGNVSERGVDSWMERYNMTFLSGYYKEVFYPRTMEKKRIKLLSDMIDLFRQEKSPKSEQQKSSYYLDNIKENIEFYQKRKRHFFFAFFFAIKMWLKRVFVY